MVAEKCHHKNVTKPSFNLYTILDTGLIDKIIQVTRDEDEQLHGKVLAGIRTSIPEDTFFSIITIQLLRLRLL